EQVANLYIGPLLNTPGGAPISTVDLREPDLERHRRFRQALEAAREAVLEPGDAIYMPALWWHGVEALDDLNVLVNYWWNEVPLGADNPFHSLLHAMLAVARLPADQRRSWGAIFDHLVFERDTDTGGHLPADLKDVQGSLTGDERAQVRQWLANQLSPKR
ncbi:MAG: cupin-like domain-containing protein, partial [Pseudomonadota bacterium]